MAGPPALPTSPPAAASPLDSALNRSPAPTPPPRAPQRSSGGDTESICTTHSSDVDVLAALPNAAGEYLQHLRLCDVEKAIAEATQLHEAGQFRTAASKFILCTELLSGLLRRILQGNAVLQDAGGQEVHPELVFRQLQVCCVLMALVSTPNRRCSGACSSRTGRRVRARACARTYTRTHARTREHSQVGAQTCMRVPET